MNQENNSLESLIDRAKEKKIFYEPLTKTSEKSKCQCEFINCENDAVLLIDSFKVCETHGFRIIECLTEKFF